MKIDVTLILMKPIAATEHSKNTTILLICEEAIYTKKFNGLLVQIKSNKYKNKEVYLNINSEMFVIHSAKYLHIIDSL